MHVRQHAARLRKTCVRCITSCVKCNVCAYNQQEMKFHAKKKHLNSSSESKICVSYEEKLPTYQPLQKIAKMIMDWNWGKLAILLLILKKSWKRRRIRISYAMSWMPFTTITLRWNWTPQDIKISIFETNSKSIEWKTGSSFSKKLIEPQKSTLPRNLSYWI